MTLQTDSYPTAGSFSWVCPAGVTAIQVDGIAGGGGGWRGNGTGKSAGGAGSSAVQLAAFTVIPGNSYAIVVGAGGAGATPTVAAVVGADTTFNGTSLVCKGGKAATGVNGPGVGQTTSCIGDTKIAGTSGTNGASLGAGGAAASVGVLTGGAGGPSTAVGQPGAAGTPPGGGGSGGGASVTLSGGTGGDGALAITYTIPAPTVTQNSGFFALL